MLRTDLLQFTLAITLGFSSASLRAPSASVTAPDERKPAPDFTLTNASGVPLRLSDFKGKVVVLDFWATWCHGCKTEIPWYMEFQKKYKSQGLVVVGVSMDEDGWTSVKPYLAKHPINYSIVIGNPDLGKLYNVEAMPVTLLIDREGNIAASRSGMVDRASFERDILALLHDRAKIAQRLPAPHSFAR